MASMVFTPQYQTKREQPMKITKEMLEAIQAEAQAAATQAKEEAEMTAQYLIAQAQLETAKNESVQRAIAQAQADNVTSETLERLEASCTAIVAAMPIYSARTRENRKFNATKFYGLNNDIANVIGILNGIQYAAAEHKSLLLSKTGLNSTLVEKTLEALGSTAYYSRNYHTKMDSKPYKAKELKTKLDTVAAVLGIKLDTSCVNEDNLESIWKAAEAKALREFNDAEEGISLQVVGQ